MASKDVLRSGEFGGHSQLMLRDLNGISVVRFPATSVKESVRGRQSPCPRPAYCRLLEDPALRARHLLDGVNRRDEPSRGEDSHLDERLQAAHIGRYVANLS